MTDERQRRSTPSSSSPSPGTSYALRSADVQHMEMVEQVTRVPNARAVRRRRGLFARAGRAGGQSAEPLRLRARPVRSADAAHRRADPAAGQVGLIVDEAASSSDCPRRPFSRRRTRCPGLSSDYVRASRRVKERLILVLAARSTDELRRAADCGLNWRLNMASNSRRAATDRTATRRTARCRRRSDARRADRDCRPATLARIADEVAEGAESQSAQPRRGAERR